MYFSTPGFRPGVLRFPKLTPEGALSYERMVQKHD